MLQNLQKLLGYAIQATNGPIGKVYDFYFDDEKWGIRYMVAETGKWLSDRKVLLSPESLGRPNLEEEILPVKLTRAQVEDSPDINTDQPISRRLEAKLHKHYGWTPYWDTPMIGSGGSIGTIRYPGVPPMNPSKDLLEFEENEQDENGCPSLRSMNEVCGYRIHAGHGQIGHLEDLIVDDESWTIRYLVIDTRNWLPGKRVLVSPDWIDQISWEGQLVYVDLDREIIKNCPEYDHSAPPTREYEEQLHDYYFKTGYWK
jgi:hypothetical protein